MNRIYFNGLELIYLAIFALLVFAYVILSILVVLSRHIKAKKRNSKVHKDERLKRRSWKK